MKETVLNKGGWRKIGRGKAKTQDALPDVVVVTPAESNSESVRDDQSIKGSLPKKDLMMSADTAVVDDQTVATVVKESKVMEITEKTQDEEVSEMEAGNAKTQTTGRGRYSNTSGGTAEVTRGGRRAAKDTEDKPRAARRGNRDLQSGLELLDLDFMLTIVENIEATDEQDITMRKLSFGELARTQRIHELDSAALKVYAMDEDGAFGKSVQVECFKELADRTASSSKV